MASRSRMDRFLAMIGGEDALPPRLPSPEPEEEGETPKPFNPPLRSTEYDSQEYQDLPKPNSVYQFGEIESALSKLKQQPAPRSTAFDTDGKIPFDSKKGESLPSDIELSPFIAVTKYCYKFVPSRWSQQLATAFFDADKIFTRDWSLYYITTHSHGLHTFVPTSQLQSLLDEVNATFEDAKIAIDEWQRENGFILNFDELPKSLHPRVLGQLTSRSQYLSWVEQLASEPNMILSTVPDAGDRSLEAFKAKLDAAAALNKGKQKAGRARKHNENLIQRQEIVRQAIRGQRYFGLHAGSGPNSILEPINPTKRVPHPFDKEPILICIDVEAYELAPNMITEVGVTTLDTRDLKGVPPGENGKNWHQFLRGRHMRILEWKDYRNSQYVQGCPGAFEFGKSEFVAKDSAAFSLSKCFQEPYSGPRANYPSTNHMHYPSTPEPRNIIVVGHDLMQDVKYCETLGFRIFDDCPSIIDTLDTMSIFKTYVRESNGRSLGNILFHFDFIGWHLHNAGNDAMYTMHALLAICVKSASGESAKVEESVEKKLELQMEIMKERAQNDADGWDLVGEIGVAKKPTRLDFQPKPNAQNSKGRGSVGGLYTTGGAYLDV